MRERTNLLLSPDSPVDQAARILINHFGAKHALAAALVQISMRFDSVPAEHFVAITRAALAAASDPGAGVYAFGQAAAEAAGEENLARMWGEEVRRLTAEAEARGAFPEPERPVTSLGLYRRLISHDDSAR